MQPFTLSADLAGAPGTISGFWLKVPQAPVTDTTLLDINAGGPGYERIKLTPQLHVIAEAQLLGSTPSVDISVNALAPKLWYWISMGTRAGVDGNGNPPAGYQLCGLVYGVGGVTAGAQCTGNQSGYSGTFSMTASYGQGVSLNSHYASFPNQSGWEMSKLEVLTGNSWGSFVAGYPMADQGGSGWQALYMVRQPLGKSTELVDTSGNNYTAVAGKHGLTINRDGPYVSWFER